jgi:hypothetical protein
MKDEVGKMKIRIAFSSFIFASIADDAQAPVAQLDRASAFEAEGSRFESVQAHFTILYSQANLRNFTFRVRIPGPPQKIAASYLFATTYYLSRFSN